MKTFLLVILTITLNFPVTSIAGEVTVCNNTLETDSTLYKAIKLLIAEVGVRPGMLGNPALNSEDFPLMQQIISKLSKPELKVLISMAKVKCLSNGGNLAIDREIQLKEFGSVKVLGKINEEKLLRIAGIELKLN